MVTPGFTIAQHRMPTGTLRVTLTGDLDLSIGDALSRPLMEAARMPGITHVVVDLEHTHFIDSHIVKSLVNGYQAATTAQRRFTVVNGHGVVQQVLDMTGLSELLCA